MEGVNEDICIHDIRLIMKFMEEHPEVTAYFAGQAGIGRCVLDASAALGNQEKIDVVFFDGPQECYYPKPYFARVIQNEKEMGYKGVHYLLKRIKGEKVPKQILTGFEIVGCTEPMDVNKWYININNNRISEKQSWSIWWKTAFFVQCGSL